VHVIAADQLISNAAESIAKAHKRIEELVSTIQINGQLAA
jgi:hypothetical protein